MPEQALRPEQQKRVNASFSNIHLYQKHAVHRRLLLSFARAIECMLLMIGLGGMFDKESVTLFFRSGRSGVKGKTNTGKRNRSECEPLVGREPC